MIDEERIFVTLLIGNLRKIFHVRIISWDDSLSFIIVEAIQIIFLRDLIGIPRVFDTCYLSPEWFVFKFKIKLAELLVYPLFLLIFS